MKKRKNNNLTRARRGVKGMIIEWDDKDPLRDNITNIKGRIRHRNPVFNLCVKDVYRDFGEWITTRQPFRWLVEITVVFNYPNGTQQNETRELEAYALLRDINEYCLDQIKDAMRHGNEQHYTTTKFKVECIDTADRKKRA